MVNRERLVREFIELVETDSESGREGKLRDLLMVKLRALGLEVEEDEAGKKVNGESGNLIARLDGTPDKPSILFSAHMDTVSPGVGVKAAIRGETIYSEGETILGSDDKAGIAAILEALRVVKEVGWAHPPLEVVFTVSEEQGLMGSKNLDYSHLSSRSGYVLDGSGEPGTIITRAPCHNEICFEVFGKAAHAGINPEDGVNAIQAAARALADLELGRIDKETTCNLGIIEGGRARNIVPGYCRIVGEARSLSRERLQDLTGIMVEHFRHRVSEYGAESQVQVEMLYPEMDLQPDDPVIKLARQAVVNLGKNPVLESTGGGSDANVFNGKGIRCANLGIGMQSVHTTDEFIHIKDLVDNARLVVEIIKEAGRT
ncbi:MAG: M20/M25/M40 family metallo-hydrolase [Syntrophomonadaceae bacterium]|nr:M20/M25/M40 family metallo-hydrolase [Syntrophomonadaceae bacterium]